MPTLIISTHSAREDGDKGEIDDRDAIEISTHSAREDGDEEVRIHGKVHNNFNPLRPRGRRRYLPLPVGLSINISTHSAREDGDQDYKGVTTNFNISTHSAREDGDEYG